MRNLLRSLLFVLLGCTMVRGVSAQTPAQEPGSNLRVFLLTMGQGNEVYERFGHNAIWIHDDAMHTDTAYNWGAFSFSQPHFIQRFLKGKMLYWMEAAPMDYMMYVYEKRQRTMWAQELNLTPAQKLKLQEFVRWNGQEANKYYTYDYYRDNCSTRARDALDLALGGQLQRTLKKQETQWTYRSETRRLMLDDIEPKGSGDPKYELINIGLLSGMDLAMGPRIDRKLTGWEDSFVPMELQQFVREVTVTGPDGKPQPLVLNERVMVPTQRLPPPEGPPHILWWYILAGVLIAAILVLAGSFVTHAWGRVLFVVLAGGWSLLMGLFGTIIALLWIFTDHVVTYGNENLLQANPLALLLFVALIGLLLNRSWGRRFAGRTSLVVAGLAVLGFVIQILPGVDQINGTMIGLLMPSWLVIAWVVQKWWPRPATTLQ